MKRISTQKSSDRSIKTQDVEDEPITETYEVTVGLPSEIGTFDTGGGNKEENNVKASISITYNHRNNKQDIQITNLNGSWVLINEMIVVSGREASVNDGTGIGREKIIRNNPNSNSFNYNTGWG